MTRCRQGHLRLETIRISERVLARADEESQPHVRLTKHEPFPSELLVRCRISNFLVKLNGVWQLAKIEG